MSRSLLPLRSAEEMPSVSYISSSHSALLRWSALFQGRHLILDPELRLRALAGLWVATAALDASPHRVRQALREAAEQLAAHRPSLPDLWPLLSSLLNAPPTPSLPDTVSALITPPERGRGESEGLIPALLELGLVAEARVHAAQLPDRTPRQRIRKTHMVRLAQTGILGCGEGRRFVPAPDQVTHFPPSLPAFVRCAAALLDDTPTHEARDRVEQLRDRLSPADQQAARMHWALVRWRLDGPAGALQELTSIRYRSLRAQAGLRLIEAALDAEDRCAAQAFAEALPTSGQSRSQARALLDSPLLPEASPLDLPVLSAARTLACLRRAVPVSSETLNWAQHHLRTPPVLRRVLAALEREGPLRSQLPMLRARLGETAVERLWSEHLTQQALCLAASPSSAARIVQGGEAERAAADEALSLREAGWSRRRVLARACRAVLLSGGATWRTRLRTLGHLGGEVASNTLCEVARRAAPEIADAAVTTLSEADPTRALGWLSAHAERLSAEALMRVLEQLSLTRHVAATLPQTWEALWQGARRLLGPIEADAFCRSVLIAWRQHTGGLPSSTALEGALAELIADPSRSHGGRLFAQALEQLRETLELPPIPMAMRLWQSRVLRTRLRWSHPERLPPRAQPWTDTDLQAVLGQIAQVGEVAPALMVPILDRLPGDREAVTQRLLLGQRPVGVPDTVSLGGPHRLRFLDKRTDLLSWLRFVDAVPNCWRSPQLLGSTRGRILSLWADPLSFCFQVERVYGEARWAAGFVFGSLGQVREPEGDAGVVALLNGVYLPRQQAQLRDRILSTIEAHMAALGVRWVAVASQFGGMGPIPDRYRRGDREVLRPRALVANHKPVAFALDDISTPINATLRLRHLFWTSVEGRGTEFGVGM